MDEVGGREAMRARYSAYTDERKVFNENLNPLKGWLRSCVGKTWNRCYSELRRRFGSRKVINAPVLQHLFGDRYIELHAFVDKQGRVVSLAIGRWTAERVRPISASRCDCDVCPRDGGLKQSRPAKLLEKARQRELSMRHR